ncbi:extracellular solute-binding protein [Deinococcus sp. HMF7604]|uniref:sugar ABC transporter substrate-binding protein n=1 Tax=Deinococcus betulae TaxID=2873312 RepID=UPI001CCDB573|nr:extracellular solute-binding protein [Deinococcus betulae]MBZ9751637.1 extracellular solute-binding protein [Deinococcus betulae]
MRRFLFTTILLLAGAGQAVPLTVWTSYVAGDRHWLETEAQAFTARTGHRVQVRQIPFDELGPRWQAAGRAGPDVVVGVPDEWLGAVIGLAAPLTPQGTPDAAGQQAFTSEGQLLGLPLMAEALALVYNAELVPRPPATWAELRQVMSEQVRAGRLGLASDLQDPYTQAGVFEAYSAPVFGLKAGRLGPADLGLATAGAVQAGTFLRELGQVEGLAGTLDDAAAQKAFTSRRLALWLTGPWNFGDLQRTGLDVRSVPLPAPPGAPEAWQPFVGRQAAMVAASSAHRAEATALARALTTDEAQLTLFQAGGRLPSSPAARAAAIENNQALSGFGEGIRRGAPVPKISAMTAVWRPWAEALRQLQAQPDQPVRAILDQAVQRIRAALQP